MPMLYSMCGISPMEWRDVMGIMPAHHGGVLKNLDEGKWVKVGLSLWATKETARAIGRSTAALLTTERHLWLNLSEIKDKDRFFLLDSLLVHTGLIGDTVNSVVDRFQEARKQAVPFQRFLPRCCYVLGGSGQEQPQSSTRSSYRDAQIGASFYMLPRKNWIQNGVPD